MDPIQQYTEALIFSSEQAIDIVEIKACLSSVLNQDIEEGQVATLIENIKMKYASPHHILELTNINGGYCFLTKKDYAPVIEYLVQRRNKKKLSVSALETLAIIAYRQPVTKFEIEQIRGVNCDYSIHKLLEKELIAIQGKSESPGRPLLYVTGKVFMDYFKLNSIKDLPQLKDIQLDTDEIMIQAPAEN